MAFNCRQAIYGALRALAVQAGLAERIVAMTEREGEHRREMEKKQLEAIVGDQSANRSAETRGQWLAASIALGAFIFGALALKIAPNAAGATVAAVLGGGALGGIITTLVVGRSKKGS